MIVAICFHVCSMRGILCFEGQDRILYKILFSAANYHLLIITHFSTLTNFIIHNPELPERVNGQRGTPV